jgi:hypothetical protein
MAAKRKDSPAWDAAPSTRKVNAHAKVKNLPEGDQETLWLLMHPTDSTVPPYTLEAALVHLQEEHGIECALSTLSEWHSWYALRKRMENAQARADQAKLEWLRENPDASPDELERLGQMVFTAESIEAGNIKGFVALMRERSKRKALEIDAAKLAILQRKADRLDELEAKAKEIKQGGGLTPETLEVMEKQLKLL